MTGTADKAAAPESELTWLSMRELATLIATREISAREALTDHFRRIEAVNPIVNAVVVRNDQQAFAQAERADEALANGAPPGALHGVPMTHKESTDVAGLPNTRGSRLLAGHTADKDALIIARLHAAGAITTGKTNVPEFTAGSHTFNDLYGTTVNPYDQERSAGGSSGGAAAAIAAGVQAGGDGSDMGGSLRTPASFTNLVGMRPSNGRVPHALPSDPWQWLTQPGFMARTVADIALLMSVASGPAAGAPLSLSDPGAVFSLPEFSDPDHHSPGEGLRGLRVGFATDLRGLIPVDPEVSEVVGQLADTFTAAGAHVDEEIPNLGDADEVFRVTRAFEFAADYSEIVTTHREQVRAAVVWNTEAGLRLSVDDLLSAREARRRLGEVVEAFFAGHDLLALTTCQVAPFPAELEYPPVVDGRRMGNYLEWMRASTIISATGCPAISVPGGFTKDGLPIGIQLVAAPGRDVELLLAAQAFEELTGHHLRRPSLG